MRMKSSLGGVLLIISTLAMAATTKPSDAEAKKIPLEITGGHETDPRDRGRPVVLIAAGLGVTEDVFREAFSRVRPAPPGERPTDERARENKEALMKALAKHGVTNERLDEVSNYYRYRRENEELWRHVPAAGFATVESGKVTGITLTEKGAGYSSVPTIKVAGFDDLKLKPVVVYGKDLKTNGRIEKIEIEKTAPTTQP